jgi:hypothetical protein
VGGVVQGFRPKVGTMTLLPITEEMEALFEGMLQRQPMHRTTLEHAARSVESFLAAAKAKETHVSDRHAPASCDALSTMLAVLKLEHFEKTLRDFGVETPADLADVKDAELVEMGFKPLKLRQLRAANSADDVNASQMRASGPDATLASAPRSPSHTLRVTGEDTPIVLAALKSLTSAEEGRNIGEIVEIMRSQPDVAAIQERAFCAFFSLAGGETDMKGRGTFADIVKSAVNAGAIEAIVLGMRMHPRSIAVQEWACRALGNFVCIVDDSRIKAGAAGVIEAVIASLRTHLNEMNVQKWGCLALVHLERCK